MCNKTDLNTIGFDIFDIVKGKFILETSRGLTQRSIIKMGRLSSEALVHLLRRLRSPAFFPWRTPYKRTRSKEAQRETRNNLGLEKLAPSPLFSVLVRLERSLSLLRVFAGSSISHAVKICLKYRSGSNRVRRNALRGTLQEHSRLVFLARKFAPVAPGPQKKSPSEKPSVPCPPSPFFFLTPFCRFLGSCLDKFYFRFSFGFWKDPESRPFQSLGRRHTPCTYGLYCY